MAAALFFRRPRASVDLADIGVMECDDLGAVVDAPTALAFPGLLLVKLRVQCLHRLGGGHRLHFRRTTLRFRLISLLCKRFVRHARPSRCPCGRIRNCRGRSVQVDLQAVDRLADLAGGRDVFPDGHFNGPHGYLHECRLRLERGVGPVLGRLGEEPSDRGHACFAVGVVIVVRLFGNADLLLQEIFEATAARAAGLVVAAPRASKPCTWGKPTATEATGYTHGSQGLANLFERVHLAAEVVGEGADIAAHGPDGTLNGAGGVGQRLGGAVEEIGTRGQ